MAARSGILVVLLLSAAASPAEEPKILSGRVLDPARRPAVGAGVSAIWSANGLDWDRVVAGKGSEKLGPSEGAMDPWCNAGVVTDGDGRFSIPAPEKMSSLMIYDRERRHGAVARFDLKHPEIPLAVRLVPLVRISGINRISGVDGASQFTCTYLYLPYDEADPLNRNRMAICGSERARFEFRVPPGTYEFGASSDTTARTLEDRRVVIPGDRPEVDLGTLILRPRLGVQDRIDRAKANGTWGDYERNFGKEPPPWHVTDAKNIAKDAKLSDYKGKWAVLYFWGPNCSPCLGKELPELMAFCEAHEARRDRFEILAFCCDFGETIHDIPTLEKHLAAVKKAVWGGKDLPFPVLLDDTFRTYERFGLEGNGVSNLLLIDPDGRLVEGGLDKLAAELEKPAAR